MATMTQQVPLTTDQKAFIASETARLDRLRKTREKYVITDHYLNILNQCTGKYQILFIVDNSASMMESSRRSPNADPLMPVSTRWFDLQTNLAAAVVDVSTIIDRDGIEVCFINPVHPDLIDPETGGTTVTNVVSAQQLDPYFQSTPHGQTLLEHVFRVATERKLRTMDANQNLIVVIATDGEPTKTDSNGVAVADVKGFREMLKHRPYLKRVFISFVSCADDKTLTGYLADLDSDIEGVDSNRSYPKEFEKVKKTRGDKVEFGYGVYICKVLCGSFNRELDFLNKERWSLFGK